MQASEYRPMNKSEIARALGVPSSARGEMRKALTELESEGVIVAGKKARFSLRANQAAGTLVGEIRFIKRGGAYFFTDLEDAQNLKSGVELAKHKKLYVPSRFSGVALDGDKVMIRLQEQEVPKWKKYANKGRKRGGKPQESKESGKREIIGKVLSVIERKANTHIGLYLKRGKFAYVQPEDTILPPSMNVKSASGARSGQIVVVRLVRWENQRDTPLCEVVKVVGWPEDPGVDILSVIHKYRLEEDFSKEVMAEAKKVHAVGVTEEEIERREDWRDRLVITIDPTDAKDFDDAISVKTTDRGWELAVHIADVSHYVKPGSELEKEALRRGNSTYLVDRVLPMLPELLSNDICSLKPEVDRLTKCAVIEVARNGELIDWRLCDAVIHSKRRFTYDQAQQVIDGKVETEGEVEAMVHEAWKMASVLRKRRFDQGSLDLDFPEIKVVLDEEFTPIRVDKRMHEPSHQLIEECMLVANEVVAKSLKRNRKPAIFRIHEEPDFEKLMEFTEVVRSHQYEPGDLTNKKHIQDLLEQIKGDPSEQSMKIALLKSLKRAAYSPDGIGHYGLGKVDYCHFTSPIRRYADLQVHRAIQSFLVNPPVKPDSSGKLVVLRDQADHISDTERNSAAAENETKKMKLMEYLWMVLHEQKDKEFDGIITECRKSGAFVEILDIHERGLVKIEDFPRGNWTYEHGMYRYVASGGRQMKLGQKVKMKLVWVNMEKQQIDLRITKWES